MSKHTPIPIPYRDPIDWAHYITIFTFALGFLSALRFIAPIFQNRWTWAVSTIVVTLVMTSGYMFVRIRGSPYSGPDGNWIASGYQNQFGQEVSVVAFACMSCRYHQLNSLTLLCRWTFGICGLDTYHGCSIPEISPASEVTSLFVDRSVHACIFYTDFLVQDKEQRLAISIYRYNVH